MRRWLCLAVTFIIASSGSTAVSTNPVAAATKCYTSFSNNNPGMSRFTIYYRNCTPGDPIAVTPYWATVGRSEVGIYEACRTLGYQQTASWTVAAHKTGLNFGVARCHPRDTIGILISRIEDEDYPYRCWTFEHAYEGTEANVSYGNCETRTVRVFPYVIETDGDIVAYLYDGPVVIEPEVIILGVFFHSYVAWWTIDVGPYPVAKTSVGWAWPYP